MKRKFMMFILLILSAALWNEQLYAKAQGTDLNVDVLKQIDVTHLAIELRQNTSGQLGLHCELKGLAVGLEGNVLRTRVDIRLRDGTPIKASAHAPSSIMTKDGKAQWGEYKYTKNHYESFSWKSFIPLTALQLPPGSSDIIVRAGAYCKNISWYRDQAFTLRSSSIELAGKVKFDAVGVAFKGQTYHLPNPSGRETANPDITETQFSFGFSSENAVSALNGESLYSGVYFKFPDGSFVKPAPHCPRGSIGKQGQAQFQQVEMIHGYEADWRGQELKVPLNALQLDPDRDNTLIAAYYISSAGLWHVQKFELLFKPEKTPDSTLDRLVAPTDVSSPRDEGKKGLSLSASMEQDGQEQTMAADLRITSFVVEPSRIKGGDEYGFTVDLEVEDLQAAPGERVAGGDAL